MPRTKRGAASSPFDAPRPARDEGMAGDLIEALRALTAGMAGQQRERDQQQNAWMAAFAAQQDAVNRLMLAQQGDRVRSSAASTVPVFSGQPGESFEEWEAAINRAATAENWENPTK